jgi:dihydrofolate synthase/folylpolyglutamate synthase
MTYTETLAAIHSRKAFSTGGPSLARIGRLMAQLGDPQEQLRAVHIAGTNGKGSVSAMTAAALTASGYKVGLFTSPYLVEFRERIQVDGKPISEEALMGCYERVMEQEKRLEQQGFEPVNEFELVTAMGFVAFSRAKVDFAVLEVGLGGRTDPTNLISKPVVSCITPISLDHTAILGDTVEKIAAEKAGIIKPGCPVVLSQQTEGARRVILETAARLDAPATETGLVEPISQDKTGSRFRYDGELLEILLLGAHQMDNAATAWEICRCLGLEKEAVKQALKHVSWPGRLQYFPGSPELLIDAGHNEAGVSSLCKALDELFPDKRIISVVAMMGDKDYKRCIPMVASRSKVLIGTTVGLPRSLKPEQVAEMAACQAFTASNVEEALVLAKSLAGPEDLILVCGSVYAAGAALEAIS